MDLGQFSFSLAVKDLDRSRRFYQAFGFRVHGGDGENYIVMRNGDCVIGLFTGMFEENIMSFNPADVRSAQTLLLQAGIEFEDMAEAGEGPAHAMLYDPDGNAILLDQL